MVISSAFLGLGGNLGNVEESFVKTIRSFISNENGKVVLASPIYRTPPWGIEDQPDYLNAVLKIEWAGSLRSLAEFCQSIESDAGRDRSNEIKWGPRSLDIDILTFGDLRGIESGIEIPHPRMQDRRFVLQPLNDIAPELIVAGLGKSVEDILDSCNDLSELVSCEMSREYIGFTDIIE